MVTKPAKCATDLTPPGYNSSRSLPRARRGCGLAVIVRESFPVTIRQKAGEEGGWGGEGVMTGEEVGWS